MTTAAGAAAVLAFAGGWLAVDGGRTAWGRLRSGGAGRDVAEGEAHGVGVLVGHVVRRGVPSRAAHVASALVALLILTGHGGLAVPLAVAAAALIVPSRRRASVAAHRDARTARDLPRVADLMATCLDAGISPADAIVLVCEVVGGPVRDDLVPVAAAIRRGVDPETAWAGLATQGSGDAVRRVARAFARAAATGAPLAATLATVADDERERLQWEAQAAARRAGVLAVGPLAACFLPAFLLLGVVPVVVGVATDVVGQLR